MASIEVKNFDSPDETRPFEGKGKADVLEIPPGHDAEVVGEEPCVSLDFGEFGDYAKR
jgi:hypothetical protein